MKTVKCILFHWMHWIVDRGNFYGSGKIKFLIHCKKCGRNFEI